MAKLHVLCSVSVKYLGNFYEERNSFLGLAVQSQAQTKDNHKPKYLVGPYYSGPKWRCFS